MQKKEKVTVRLSRDLLDSLIEITQKEGLRLSDCIREAIKEYTESKTTPFLVEEKITKVTIELHPMHMEKLQMLIDYYGEGKNIPDAVMSAIKWYISKRPVELIQERENLKKLQDDRRIVNGIQTTVKERLKK